MLSYRKFTNERDYSTMQRIVQENCLKTGHLFPQLHIGHLDFDRYPCGEDPHERTRIVSEGSSDLGFIVVPEDADDEFVISVLPEFQYHLEEIIGYVEDNCYSEGTCFTVESNSENEVLNAVLEEKGYVKADYFRYCGICDLSELAATPQLAEGYSIRQTLKSDLEKRVELFVLATGGLPTTLERYERMMDAPLYKSTMDLVVQTQDGEVIAYCTLWDDPVSKIGLLEPLACVEEHRRKGIMKSLLLYGMNELKIRGTERVYVSTGGKNTASQALYKSVGFKAVGTDCEWEKTL